MANSRADEGLEFVKANSWDVAELDSASKGAHVVFLNTDLDDPNFKWVMDIFWREAYKKAFGSFATNLDKEGSLILWTFPMSYSAERTLWSSVRDNLGDAMHGVLLDPGRYDERSVWAISEYTSFQDVKLRREVYKAGGLAVDISSPSVYYRQSLPVIDLVYKRQDSYHSRHSF